MRNSYKASSGNIKNNFCQDITLKLISLLNKEMIFSDFFESAADILLDQDYYGGKAGIFVLLKIKPSDKIFARCLSEDEKKDIEGRCRAKKENFSASLSLIALSLPEAEGFLAIKAKSCKFNQNDFTVFKSLAEIMSCKFALCRKDIMISAEKDTLDSAAHIEKFFSAFPDIPPAIYSKTVLEETRRITKCEASYACLFDSDGNAFNEFVSADRPELEEAIRTEGIRLIPSMIKAKKMQCFMGGDGLVSSFAAVPVLYGGKPHGLLMLANPESGFGSRISRILGRMAQLYSLLMTHKIELRRNAVQNAEIYSALAKTWDLIFTFNIDGQITYMSPSVKKMGYKVEEVEGHNFREFVPEEDIPRLEAKLAEVLKTGKPSPVFIYRILKKDGTILITQLRIVINRVEGMPVSISAILRDITDDIKHIEELHEKQIFYETVFSKSPLAICIADPMTRKIATANRNAEKFFGKQRNGLAGADILSLFIESEKETVIEQIALGMNNAASPNSDTGTVSKRLTAIGKDGTEFPAMVSFTYINSGTLLIISEDVSSKMRYKQEIGFRLVMLNNVPDFLYAADLATGNIIFANKTVSSIVGIPAKELIGRHISVLFSSKEDAEKRISSLNTLSRLHEKITITDRNGKKHDLESFSQKVRLGGKDVAIIASRDISEQEAMERELQKTNATMSAILKSLPDHVQLFDQSGNTIYENRSFRAGKKIKNTSDESKDFSLVIKRFLSQVIRTRTPVSFTEEEENSDEKMAIERRIVPIQDGTGKISGTAMISRDYTEERKKRSRILELEFILNHLFETSQDFIYVMDRQGRYLMINQAAAARHGMNSVEMKGKTNAELGIKEGGVPFKEILLAMEQKKSIFITGRHQYKAGTFYESISCSPVLDNAGNATSVIVAGRDITKEHEETTDRALSAAKEIVSMKMRPVGHDFNNIFTVINGYATLLLETSKGDTRMTAGLRQILKAVERATKLTEKFQTYARNPVLSKEEK